MPRVALLVGVSRYGRGLDPLPDAQKDVEVMKRVLKQPRFQFDVVQCLCDRPLTEMQEGIESFFQQRHRDDQLVVLFCGYLLHDAESHLYFATPSSQLDEQGAIDPAQAISAHVVQNAMNQSSAKQQVFILDRYSQPEADQSAGGKPIDLEAQLGGARRVILTATHVSQTPLTRSLTLDTLDVWTYPHYLVEGIESGAADTNDDGILTAADLHHYAAQKLQVAAPALKPALYGSTETAQMPLLEVPNDDPRLHYRKVLETAPIAIDAAGDPVLEGLPLLKDMRQSLGVSPQEADALEAQVLRPKREYRQRAALYQEQVTALARSHDGADTQSRQTLKQWQDALHLHDRDVALMTLAPSLVGQQRQRMHHQGNLAQYQQVLLWAMQRQYPLRDSDRTLLQRLQQTLRLGDDDVSAIEHQITTQAEQFIAPDLDGAGPDAAKRPDADTDRQSRLAAPGIAASTAIPALSSANPSSADLPSAAPPSAESLSTESLSAEPTSAAPVPDRPVPNHAVPDNGATAPVEESRAKEAVVQRLFSMNEVATPAESTPPTELQQHSVPDRDQLPPHLPNAKPNPMDRVRRSASNYQALLIPALLLAAIIGLLVAILPSAHRPDWLKFGETPADPAAAQRLTGEGRQRAQAGDNKAAIDSYNQAIQKNPDDTAAYTNRGVSQHRLGHPDAAIRDYEQALKRDPNSTLLHSNLSYAYYDRQNYDKALEEGNRAVALNGNWAEAHVNLANARSKKGDYDGALRDYAQALALPSSASVQAGAYNNRGNLQLTRGNAKAAIDDYSRAIRLKPDYADAYYNLGLVQSQGNRAEAIRNLQTAATLYQTQGKDELQKDATDRVSKLQKGNVQSL